jgi:MerR family transcriptional regulator, light-induced transcriptional regulator
MPEEAPDGAAARVYREFLDALLHGGRQRARAVVAAARREAGLDVRALYLEVFQPALRQVGVLWQENRISVAEEHLATAVTEALMAELYTEMFSAAGTAGRTVVAACADSERHEVGLRMICDLLELEGWDTSYLGASVPPASLVEMVAERRPDVVALSAALLPHVARLEETIEALRQRLAEEAPLLMVGGRPFVEDPALAARIGADLTATDAADAVARLQEHFGL